MTVTLNKDEILQRANGFMREFADAHYEMGEAQNFIRGLCDVFGFSNKRMVSFEQRVKKLGGKSGRIDGFYPGKLLIEMKSKGEDLDEAFKQATQYLPGLAEPELPTYCLVSDFENLHLYNLQAHTPPLKHKLPDFAKYIDNYLFLADYEPQAQKAQIAVDESAARKIAQLHDAMRAGGYTGEDLQRYLVRLLFCLFAEDTGIFQRRGDFARYIRQHTREDATDLDGALQRLFDALNRPPDKRPRHLPHELELFPYINGSVFEGQLAPCYFQPQARQVLLDCAEDFDWSDISPAIFGSLFQAVIHHDDEGVTGKSSKRRELGAHYTSETNILRVIGPLFLDELKTQFAQARSQGGSVAKLQALLQRLRRLNWLDPACGCGNFLVIAYREIRRLELDVVETLQAIDRRSGGVSYTLDAKEFDYIQCDVHQFHGIEIEPSAAHIATVALWLTDHQENLRASRALGGNFNRLPLVRRANIVCANALTLDWASVLLPELCDYVMGNPPFLGKSYQSADQKRDLSGVLFGLHGAGDLDFVAGWYVKAARYLRDGAIRLARSALNMNQQGLEGFDNATGASAAHSPNATSTKATRRKTKAPHALAPAASHAKTTPIHARTRCAFVSTNSITQGEQVGVLWGWMLGQGMKIQFAHRTFQWSNDAKGVAAVHCVIIGFGTDDLPAKVIFDYPDIKGHPVAVVANNINPYLVDAADVVLSKRSSPMCAVSAMVNGSKPTDGGHLLLDASERDQLLAVEPQAAPWIRTFMGAEEFINGKLRYCLWLENCPPATLKAMPRVLERVQAVRRMRMASTDKQTRADGQTPTLFQKIRQPASNFLLVPSVSSERRDYVPIGFMTPTTVISNLVYSVPDATLFHFGILASAMHNAWMRATCGRLKSDYRYSVNIVYNNFPWPDLRPEPSKPAHQATAAKAATANQGLSAAATASEGPSAAASSKRQIAAATPRNDFSADAAPTSLVAQNLMLKKRAAIEAAAQAVLDARAAHPGATLADLYDPLAMPPNLRKAHQQLDKAVDAAYAYPGPPDDAGRVAFLFALHTAIS